MTEAPWLGEMTAKERASALGFAYPGEYAPMTVLIAAIRDAELRMREAAAKVCEDRHATWAKTMHINRENEASACAAAIRRLP